MVFLEQDNIIETNSRFSCSMHSESGEDAKTLSVLSRNNSQFAFLKDQRAPLKRLRDCSTKSMAVTTGKCSLNEDVTTFHHVYATIAAGIAVISTAEVLDLVISVGGKIIFLFQCVVDYGVLNRAHINHTMC